MAGGLVKCMLGSFRELHREMAGLSLELGRLVLQG
jgi:hypothetical protein